MFSLRALGFVLHRIPRRTHSHTSTGALLQLPTKSVPPGLIYSKSVCYCSCSPSWPKHALPTPSSSMYSPSSTESCSRLLAAVRWCLEAKRSLHLSQQSCTRATDPLMKSNKPKIDRSLVPELLEKDLVEVCMRGSGPGGQAVSTTNNAVYLKHVPTGLSVKVHQHRMRHHNSKEARQMLQDKLDDLVNGPKSVSAQKARLLAQRSAKNEGKARKMRELKAQWKQAQESAAAATSEDSASEGLVNASEAQDVFRDENRSYGSSRNEGGGLDGLRGESGGECAQSDDRLCDREGDGGQGNTNNKTT